MRPRDGQALVDYDFARGIYRLRGVGQASPTGLTVTQAGTTYGTTAAGVLVSFGANTPRVTNLGLLLEPSATNLIVRSQTLDNADWTKTSATITADAAAAPDGTTTADRLIDDATNGVHRAFAIATVANGQTYDLQAFCKPAGLTQVHMMESTLGGGVFDLAGAGSVLSGVGSIEALANGYYRVGWTQTSTATSWVVQMRSALAGNSIYPGVGNGLDIWGVDLKLSTGIGASSYVPTAAAPATRAADVATLTMPEGAKTAVVFHSAGEARVPVTGGANFDLMAAGSPWIGRYIRRLEVR